MKRIIFVVSFIFLASANAYAELQYCNNIVITDVWVEGDRDDNHALQNMLVIRVKDHTGNYYNCGEKAYLHLENASSAYAGMLSVALAAQAQSSQVEIAYNTSKTTSYSNQLAFIRIKK